MKQFTNRLEGHASALAFPTNTESHRKLPMGSGRACLGMWYSVKKLECGNVELKTGKPLPSEVLYVCRGGCGGRG